MFYKKKLIVILLATVSTLAAAIMGACVKYLSNDINTFIICFYRCLIGFLILCPFIALKNFNALKSNNIKLQFNRSMINIISMICWFSALGMMQLEKATALGFTTPLFTTILAVLLLKEGLMVHMFQTMERVVIYLYFQLKI